ncbi:MAG: radical SAM family heme chaperone HemW [Acidimicrobiales bacterium]
MASGAREGVASEFGVYVHIPFCARRCDYCAFATWTDKFDLAESYVDACVTDIGRARARGQLRPATTVYLGGGTPSLLPPELLTRLLEAIERTPGAEVTIEANPESTTRAFLLAAARAGATRISLGVQSLVPRVLVDLGRRHRAGAVARAVTLVGEVGFPTYNVDVVYGSVAESDDDLVATLAGLIALEPSPPHVSAYALTVEAATPLGRDPDRHPDDDVEAARYELVDETLGAAGLSWYEISNWSRPGHECRHNLACWRGAEYLGFGCAAHSHLGARRFRNVGSPERYIARVAAGVSPVASAEHLGPAARELESLQLALRTRDGVAQSALPEDPALEDLVVRRAERAVLTRKGRLLANEVAIRLRTRSPADARPDRRTGGTDRLARVTGG